jgi:hypothetical protein
MIKKVALGEEIIIATKNKIGLLADISKMLADNGINIEASVGYEEGNTAKLMLVTSANLTIIAALKEKGYKSVKETEVVIVELENKPGALKVLTTELATNKIDIEHSYVTTCSCGCSSRMVLKTNDNETAMVLLKKFTETTNK